MRSGLDERGEARLAWWVTGLVIVPTLLLAVYGAAAIRWQREATESALEGLRRDALHSVERQLLRSVDLQEAALRRALAGCTAEPVCAPSVDGAVIELVSAADLREGAALWQGDWGQLRVDSWAARWRPEQSWLTGRADEAGAGVLPGSRFGVTRDTAPALRDVLGNPEASLPLPAPLDAWRLTHRWTDEGPIGRSLARTGWALGIGLAALVGLVLLGTGLALTAIARGRRLSRLQTDFVSSVSHELRTPLTSIRLFVETLQSGRLSDPERIAECLDLLMRETERLDRRIERVLGWARMEAGRRVYAFEAVPVGNLVADALAALHSQILPDREPVDVRLAPDLPPVRADHDAVVEALLNLLTNAVRHAPRPRAIAVEGLREGRRVGISVIDDGPGIPKADRKRAFERFWQGDPRLSAPGQRGAERGSGLGLAIVAAIARGHGGAVALQSDVGRGCRFTLWLPVAAHGVASSPR
jgi:two-component system phosphate regulon sensor histidine kinase PhoR